MPRFYCPTPLTTGQSLDLPDGPARHVQVLRLQPGSAVTLFNGEGGEYVARVTQMGRASVHVEVGVHHSVEREAQGAVHLLVGMPTNERMDWLVEKATELGASSVAPLVTERTILKLSGERAEKKRAHWQAIAVAACEQCGRNRVPRVHAAQTLENALAQLPPNGLRLLLSLDASAQPVGGAGAQPCYVLSGPEGGLSASEELLALSHRFIRTTVGPRVLRAETAPLALLAALTLNL
jgi:16S rRNA (uracil1498-N3)-methyltransferase